MLRLVGVLTALSVNAVAAVAIDAKEGAAFGALEWIGDAPHRHHLATGPHLDDWFPGFENNTGGLLEELLTAFVADGVHSSGVKAYLDGSFTRKPKPSEDSPAKILAAFPGASFVFELEQLSSQSLATAGAALRDRERQLGRRLTAHVYVAPLLYY